MAAPVVTINGNSWPTTKQTATKTTIGLDTNCLLTGTITHVPSDDLPPEAIAAGATGYLEGTENTACNFSIQPYNQATSAFASGNDYCVQEFWARFVRTPNALPVSLETSYLWRCNNVNIGAQTRLAAGSNITDGIYLEGAISGVGTPTSKPLPHPGGYDPFIPFNRWFKVTAVVTKHASTAVFQLYINGTLVWYSYNADTSAFGQTTQVLTVFAAHLGVVMQITGPIKAWTTDERSTITPDLTQMESNEYLQDVFRMYGLNNNGDFTSTGGTINVYPEGDAGVVFGRYNAVIATGQAAGVMTTTRDIGPLRFNRFGWANMHFSQFWIGSTGTIRIQIYGKRGTKPIKDLTFSNTWSEVKRDGTTSVLTGTVNRGSTAQNGNRYALALSLHENGYVGATLADVSTRPQDADPAHLSARLENWVPQDIGRIVVTLTPGAALDVKFGNIYVGPRLAVLSGDSISCAQITTAGGSYTRDGSGECPHLVPNTIARYFPNGYDEYLIPGLNYPLRSQGYPNIPVTFAVGCGGQRRSHFALKTIPKFDQLHGVVHFHAGSFAFNDLSTDITTADTINPTIQTLLGHCRTTLQHCIDNQNWLITTSILDCPLDGEINTPSEIERGAITIYRTEYQRLQAAMQRDGLFTYCDVHQTNPSYADYYDTGDAIHPDTDAYPTDSGANLYARTAASVAEVNKTFGPRKHGILFDNNQDVSVHRDLRVIEIKLTSQWKSIANILQDWAYDRGINIQGTVNKIVVVVTGNIKYRLDNVEFAMAAGSKTFEVLDIDSRLELRAAHHTNKVSGYVEIYLT